LLTSTLAVLIGIFFLFFGVMRMGCRGELAQHTNVQRVLAIHLPAANDIEERRCGRREAEGHPVRQQQPAFKAKALPQEQDGGTRWKR
jgi:hypothetical protein